MKGTPPLQFWFGQTVHQRFTPFEQRFRYRLFLVDIDIDRLDEAHGLTHLFSVDRPSLFSFHSGAHGAQADASSLRPWAEKQFANAGVDLSGGIIRLVTFPRHQFFKFAPISMWYGYSPNGNLAGIIYEVRNTFGERHSYVSKIASNRSVHVADKALHVSPFFDVTGQYKFTLRTPTDRLSIAIESNDDSGRTHIATLTARAAPANAKTLVRGAVTMPFSTLGVTVGIHWQALKLWLRGAGYRSPIIPESASSIAQETKKDTPEGQHAT